VVLPSKLYSLLSTRQSARTMTAYVQDSWRPMTGVTVSPGVRISSYDLASSTVVDPRVSAVWEVLPRFHVNAGWSMDHQQASRITYEDRVRGDRSFWMLADGTSVPVSRANTFSGGGKIEVPGIVFDVQAYYRSFDDLTIFAPRLDPGLPPTSSTVLWHHGTGKSMGIEAVVQREWNRFTLWGALSASKAELTFPTLEADPFPASWDRRQEFKVAASYRMMARWYANATLVAASGQPYTPAVGLVALWYPTGLTLNQPTFDPKNSDRLSAYHRLDLSTEREFRLGGFRSTLGVAVFNVYNQANIALRTYELAATTLTLNELTAMGRVYNAYVRVGF